MGPEGAVNILYKRELDAAADPARGARREGRRVPREVRESVHRRRARLRRRGDPPARDAPQADHGAQEPREQARQEPAEEARQHPALETNPPGNAVTKDCKIVTGVLSAVRNRSQRPDSPGRPLNGPETGSPCRSTAGPWDVDAQRASTARTLSLIVGPGASYDVGIVPDAATGMLRVRVGAAECAVAFNGRRGAAAPDDRDSGASGPQRLVAPMPGQDRARRGEAGRGRSRAPAGRGHRSDEDGKRAARGPRRHVAEVHAREGALGRGRRAAGRHPVKFLARLRAHWAVRFGVRALTIAIALLVAAHRRVADHRSRAVGARARRAPGSKYLKRPCTSDGCRSTSCAAAILLEDFSIDGLTPGDRPFFTAKRLSLGLDWLTAFRRVPEFTITSVEMTDWQMLVERWEDRTTSRGSPGRRPAAGPAAVHDDAASICGRGAASSRTRITRRRGASSAPNIDSTSRTCRSTTATPRSTAASCRSRTRADVGEHQGAVRDRRPAGPPRSHRDRHRRRDDGRDAATSTSRTGRSRPIR